MSLTSGVLPTFRDPAGSLELRNDGAYRTVYSPHDAETMEFLGSLLARQMVQSGQLISSEILSLKPELKLRHRRLPFLNFPWEWSPSMWSSAAELTLGLCGDLLKEGWVLKDATPLNVVFEGCRPVFVDVLSFARADLSTPIWLAYGQFVRTFLLPLLTYTDLGWPLQATVLRRDGYEPEDIAAVLPWFKRLRQPALSAITLPLFLSRHKTSQTVASKPRSVSSDAGAYILGRTIGRLQKQIRRLEPQPRESAWSGYTDALAHYTKEDVDEKVAFVKQRLDVSRPQCVLDVGCNTGSYSKMAAESGARVVAIDTDLQSVDQLFRSLRSTPIANRILPLCVDLARPTPAVGWDNRENASFLSRCEGQFDLVLMLAVIHHLLLVSQIPLGHVASLCRRLTKRNLVIEWVPPTDEKYQEVLRGRDAIYTHINEGAFRAAFGESFLFLEERRLANSRILFHMCRKDV